MMSTGLLSSFLNAKPEASPAGPMHVEMLPISYIMPNPDNKKIYIVGDVERLKDDIKANGVRQPLEVIRWANGYKLIGGERRLTACKQLAAEGDERFTTVPCTIVESKGELEDKISLITANATARDLTDWERVAQYEALKAALEEKKRQGHLEGKVRDEVRRILGISTGTAARLNIVASTQNETIKERLRAGEMGFMQAVKYAQDYARFMGQESEEPEPEEPPKAAPAVTIPKKEDFPECKKNLSSPRAATAAGNSTADIQKVQGVDAHGTGAANAAKRQGTQETATENAPAMPSIYKSLTKKSPDFPVPPEESRGNSTLYKLAQKTLVDNVGWIFDRDFWRFKLTFRYKELPGKAKLWRLDDDQRDALGLTPGENTRYAIILDKGTFLTSGWEDYNATLESLVKYFDLK
nr:MAG TPA: chromosome partitioning protein [Caudoviricetes sp.]